MYAPRYQTPWISSSSNNSPSKPASATSERSVIEGLISQLRCSFEKRFLQYHPLSRLPVYGFDRNSPQALCVSKPCPFNKKSLASYLRQPQYVPNLLPVILPSSLSGWKKRRGNDKKKKPTIFPSCPGSKSWLGHLLSQAKISTWAWRTPQCLQLRLSKLLTFS